MNISHITFTRKFGAAIAYTLLFILISAGVYIGVVKLFTIKEIKVMGNNIQVVVDQRRLPRTLLFFPSDRMRSEILSQNPILSDIKFEKKYPHTLVIVPVLRSATALIISPSRRVFIDSRGIVLSDADTTPGGLPQISISIPVLRVGEQIADTRIAAILEFTEGIRPLLPIETVTVTDDGLIRAHTGTLDILFTQDIPVRSTLTTLQTLLSGFRIKGTLPTVIDLRFDKPIVKF